MAQLYADQKASARALPSSPTSTLFQEGPILRYLNRLHCQLLTCESSLNETAIEKELYATENETPSMDLLTCSSALTNSSSINQRSATAASASNSHPTRSKVESTSGCKWSCTGQYKPAMGLGPLAELFSRVSGRSEAVLHGGVTFNTQLKDAYPRGQCYEASSQQLESNQDSRQATFVPHHETTLSQEPLYSCQFSREYNGSLPPTASYDNSDNYSYGYTQNDFENGYQLTAPFSVGGTVTSNCQFYSTNPDEWYSIPPVTIVDNLNKYNDNMDVRLNGYTDYGFQQASASHY